MRPSKEILGWTGVALASSWHDQDGVLQSWRSSLLRPAGEGGLLARCCQLLCDHLHGSGVEETVFLRYVRWLLKQSAILLSNSHSLGKQKCLTEGSGDV